MTDDLVTRACGRLDAFATAVIAATGNEQVSASAMGITDITAHLAMPGLRRRRWVIEAAAALLGQDPPTPTRREVLLSAAAQVTGRTEDDEVLAQLIDAGWQPRELASAGNGCGVRP